MYHAACAIDQWCTIYISALSQGHIVNYLYSHHQRFPFFSPNRKAVRTLSPAWIARNVSSFTSTPITSASPPRASTASPTATSWPRPWKIKVGCHRSRSLRSSKIWEKLSAPSPWPQNIMDLFPGELSCKIYIILLHIILPFFSHVQ